MSTQTIRKILTRDFILGSSAQFVFMMAFYILVPTLPIYLARSKANETEIGFLVGIFFVSALVFRPFVGKALQKIPEKTFMIAGALLFALTSFAYLLAPPFWPFLIVRIFQGIALALFHTASFTLIANISPKAHWGESFSYFFLASNFSLALAPPLGMFIVNRFSFSVLFVICLGASLCSLCIAAKLGRKQVAPLNPSLAGKDSFLNSKAVPPSIISFFTMITWGALTAFFPLYALDHGVSDPGLFFTAVAIVLFLCRGFGGRILDLYSKERVIPPLITTYVASMTLLAFSTNLPMFILVAGIFGIGNALLGPVVMAYALDRAGSSPGPVVGTYTAISDLGLGLGPVIMGIVVHFSGYSIMFLCLALTGVMNLVYFYFFVRKGNVPARESGK
jgi:MFS family permease